MARKMIALIKEDVNRQVLRKVPIPDVGLGEILVRVNIGSICGTDIHICRWNEWAKNAGIPLPLIMGHEGAGDVVECGPGVKHVKPEDRVALESHVVCGMCFQCTSGQQHICHNVKILGVHTNGCFAEYVKIPAECAYPLPDSIGYEIGTLLEPFGIAFRPFEKVSIAGKTVLVLGSGRVQLE